MDSLFQEITAFLQVASNPLAISVLTIIGVLYLPKIPFFNRSLRRKDNYDELKPILSEMTQTLAKISGNDLEHVAKSIDRLGTNFDDFRTRDFSSHNIQAKHINDTVDNIWKKIEA